MSNEKPLINIPGYQVIRLIGKGGMAKVYLAKKEGIQDLIALKVINADFSDSENFQLRFQKEVQILGSLKHPNIVRYYGAGKYKNHIFMALEYIEGQDLKKRIKKGEMSPDEVVKVFSEVALALDYSHTKGFIHRDIKPENVLLRKDGSAVLTDFGIAKARYSATKVTGTGLSIGTPYYMSPEQARGQKVGPKTDIYSSGVMLFEILTGSVPFSGVDPIAIGIAHITKNVPTLPSKYVYWQPIINRMMDKDEKARYVSMERAVEDIKELQKSNTLEFKGSPESAEEIRRTLLSGVSSETKLNAPIDGTQLLKRAPQTRVSQAKKKSPSVVAKPNTNYVAPKPTALNDRRGRGAKKTKKRFPWLLILLIIGVASLFFWLFQIQSGIDFRTQLTSNFSSAIQDTKQPPKRITRKRPPSKEITRKRPLSKETTRTIQRPTTTTTRLPKKINIPAPVERKRITRTQVAPVRSVSSSSAIVRKVMAHMVLIPGTGLRVSLYELSIGEYNDYARVAGRAVLSGNSNMPVRSLSLAQFEAYAAFLSQYSTLRFLVPTRSEWIRTVTGNVPSYDFAWGQDPSGMKASAVCRSVDCAKPNLQAVRSGVKPTIFGLIHAHGNIAEMTRTCRGSRCYVMGGSYISRPGQLSISSAVLAPSSGGRTVGLRLVAR